MSYYNHKNEYGGYLPLELRSGKDYFNSFHPLRFNCANAAIDFVLQHSSFDKIYIPYYLCPNVCQNLNSSNVQCVYYSIGEELIPQNIPDEDNVCIYIVDYFGVMPFITDKLVRKYKKSSVIFDLCHSFFHSPIIAKNVYNIYSARKFFGVPDGAYLISAKYSEDNFCIDTTYSSDYSSYLITSAEHGTNYSYVEKKDADAIILENKGGMSLLSQKILNSVNYDEIKHLRKENAKMYNDLFSKINLVNIEEGCSPYMYPLNCGKNIKKELIQERIYVPTLWSHLLTDAFKGKLEYKLADETLFLPLDQRYNKEDIKFIASIVKKYIDI